MSKLQINLIQKSSIFGDHIYKDITLNDLASLLNGLVKMTESDKYAIVIKKQKQSRKGTVVLPIIVKSIMDYHSYLKYTIIFRIIEGDNDE